MSDERADRVAKLEEDMQTYRETIAKSRAAVDRAREVIAEGQKLNARLGITPTQARAKMIEMGFRKAPNNSSPMKRVKRRMAI
ncbi:MAG: hypothetical protein AAF565_11190 [Pseudomonadota bacterium]